ncbi:hypothetical protein [Azospirillum sp. Marseille-Q6669]
MKRFLFFIILALLPNIAAADTMTASDIINTLKRNNMDVLIPMYEKGILILDSKNTTVNAMKLVRNYAAFADAEAEKAKFWYRGMPTQQANDFINSNYSRLGLPEKSFVGIAPRFSYVMQYVTNSDPGVVFEFGTDSEGWLYKQWSVDHPCQIKAEGGGTYGLGPSGTYASCNNGPNAYKPKIDNLGGMFNKWLADNTITAKVAYVLANRKL